MSQKTLLSFFRVKTKEDEELPDENENRCSTEDSPIKATKKKRQRIESSESEEEKIETKTPNKKSIGSKLAKFSASPKQGKCDVENLSGTPTSHSPQKGNDKSIKRSDIVSKLAKFAASPKEVEVSSKTSKAKKRSVSPEENTDKNNIASNLTEVSIRSDTKHDNTDCQNQKSPGKELIPNLKQSPMQNEKKPDGTAKGFFGKTSGKGKVDETPKYNPAAVKYHPIDDACWKHGEKVPYYALARTLEEIEAVSARLKMIEILSNYLRSVMLLSPADTLPSIYLCLNRVGPAHEGLEMGLAEATLIRAISQSTGRTVTQIRGDVQETGDLGTVAEKSRSSQKLMFQPAALTVSYMFSKFREIAAMTGQTAVNRKIQMIQALYVACKGPEAKFLIRSLNGKLRIGLAEQSVLQAIALACTTTPPTQTYPPEVVNAGKSMSSETFKGLVEEQALTLKTTYCECPNYDTIVPVILKEGIKALPLHCKITPGLPMKPMLAQPTKGVQEVLTRFDGIEFTCEWKYDGERAQIHGTDDGTIKIYSRNQENNTSKYPDIIARIGSTKKATVRSFILDCEAVAWNKDDGKILPFQVLSTRKRKDVNEADIKVQVCVFMFDLLYLNGTPLVKEKLIERRRLLHENFEVVSGEWQFATAIDTSKMEEVQEFLEESIKGNCEGLMVKTLKEEATYEIAKRSRNWLKLKKDYLEGVGDTLDLVVLGGYLGKGKRAGTYGGFLLGCYDEDTEEYQSLCKIGTGFSDEDLSTHTDFFKPHIVSSPPAYYRFDSGLTPDHWFEPVQVWETKCADLSLSPVHRAALGIIDPAKGISLRFPRFLQVREDKKPEDATTARQIADMYQNQEQVKQQQGGSKFNEEDFY